MSSCLSTIDCSTLQTCVSNLCLHKPFFPLSYLDIITLILVFISSIITTVAGVGGGIFFFPIFMGVNNFAPTPAVANSLSIVMFLMIIRYLMSYKERHPIKDRPLINYDVSLIFCPSSIVGTIFGVLFNRISPNWFLLTVILISLGSSMFETWKKAQQQKNKEKLAITSPLLIPMKPLKDIELANDPNNTKLKELLDEESKVIPIKKLKILLLNMLALIVCLILQGSKNAKSLIGIDYCGAGYWFFMFLYIPLGAFILKYSIELLSKEYNIKQEAGYEFLSSDIKWDKENVKKGLLIGLFIGFSSAVLGVGGAVVTGPLLIELGFDAREATFTATFIAVFTSISGALQYIFAGLVQMDYLFFCLSIGLVGLWIGMKHILDYVKRTNKTSIIMQTLTFCVGAAMILVALPGLQKTVQDYQSGSLLRLRNFC